MVLTRESKCSLGLFIGVTDESLAGHSVKIRPNVCLSLFNNYVALKRTLVKNGCWLQKTNCTSSAC